MQGQYNMRSPAVKRLMKEAQELKDPTELYHAQPLEDNLFEWHFTLRGPEDSDFDSGIYHGRIILPPEYPMKPPSIILLTPNGRFETYKKICLSISGHHPESWQPSWSIRTALLAIIGFMPTHGGGAIGSLDYTTEERKVLAKKSQDWKCPECGDISRQLKPRTEASEKAAKEAKELASQINFQGEKQGGTPSKTNETNPSSTTTPTATTPTATDQSTPATTTPTPPPFPQSPFPPHPWAMLPGWGGPLPQQNLGGGSSTPLTYPRFPYPPPMMLPHPGMFMPNAYGQRMPGFPPMPFFSPPGVRAAGFPFGQGAGGAAVSEGTRSSPPQQATEAAAAAATSSPVATQPTGSAPSNATTTASPSSTSDTKPTTASSVAATSSSAEPSNPATSSTPPSSTAGVETVGAAAAAAAAASPTETSSDATDTTTQTSATSETTTTSSPAPSSELRQRTTTAAAAATTTSASTQPSGVPATSSAPLTQTQGSYSRGTIVMMVLLSLAITFLLGRRVYMMYAGRGFL